MPLIKQGALPGWTMTEFDELVCDPIALTQKLVSFNTMNPPGKNEDAAQFLCSLLQHAGFNISTYEHLPGRVSLVARIGPLNADRSLCFAGHLDTVPLGKTPWLREPFAGEIADGRLYGRGATDMKSGVAAFIVAAASRARVLPADAELVLLLFASEETGCEGSKYFSNLDIPLDHFDGIIVAEPTTNMPLLGHKGALWLKAISKGVSAHGAMPCEGDNAIRKAMKVADRISVFFDQKWEHPVLGKPTINIGTFHAGESINLVPDWAEIGIDIRTVPGMNHNDLIHDLREMLAPDLHELLIDLSLSHVYTPPDHPWVDRLFEIVERESGHGRQIRTASYFTDASALKPVIGDVPLVILGPGEPELMHKTDEYCNVARIHEAVRIYTELVDSTLEIATSTFP
jgi:succinyl-diaminopimelate desuccinylase